jgi:RND family efflux transporter MFP subunit
MKKYMWVLGIIIVLGIAAYFYFTGKTQTSEQEQIEESVKTSKVRKGDIVISASGVGTVVSPAEIQLGFSSSGVIEEIFVEEGELVSKGDVVAKLEDDPQLVLDLETQKIAVITEQAAYDEFMSNLDADLAAVTIEYLQAKSDLESLLTERVTMDYPRCGEDYVIQYEADYASALDSLTRLQDKYDQSFASRSSTDLGKIQLEADIVAAQMKVDIAYANVQYCLSYPTQEEKDLIDAQITLKESQISDLEKEMTTLQSGFDPTEAALQEAKLAQAKAKLAVAEENLNGLLMIAPMDGTIMNISEVAGQYVGNNTPVVRIADLSKRILEVFLDETDLDKLVVGYEAEIIFDAFDDEIFKGTVISITPELIKNGNVSYVHGWVELDQNSFGKPMNLPLGLNASIDIIGGRSENTILIPIEALRPLGDGSFAVFVLENGEPKLRMVEVGLTDFTTAEILSGLKVGEEVTTGIVEIAE